jgi:hypothetical protein
MSIFLFKDLVFLITSLGFSMPLYSGELVEEGFLKANTNVFSVVVLCFDNSRHFFYINNESIEGVCDSDSLVIKKDCGKGFRVGKVICISFYLDESVLISKLVILFISFCTISPCCGVGVLKFSDSIFSI